MKYKLLLLLFCPILALAQPTVEKINNQLNKNYKNVPGTKLHLIPPDSFTVATNFNGFQQEATSSSILVVEIPGPFSEIAKGFTKEGLQSKSVLLLDKKTLAINQYQALLITAEQEAYETVFSKFILVFGNDTATVMVNGTFPKERMDLAGPIRASLLSAFYESGLQINPLEAVNFKVDVNGTKLRFAKMMSNTLIFTTDGLVPAQSADKTNLVVGTSLGKIEIPDPKQYALDRLKKYQMLKEMTTETVLEVAIDSLSGYEIVARAKDGESGNPILLYQVMLFGEEGYYLMIGMARDELDQNLGLFRKISRTFRRK